MPIPFLLGGAAAVLAAAVGASSHKDAKETNEKAEGIVRKARSLYNDSKESLEKTKTNTEQMLLKLGYEKKNVLNGSMKCFVEVYDKIKNIQIKGSEGLDEISHFSIEQQDIVQIKAMSDIYSGSIQSGAAGAATGAIIALAASGTLPIVTGTLSVAGACLSLGSVGAAASIAGSAISTAFSATPLAAVVAPALFFTGVSASMKADENLEKAEEMYAEAERATEEMKISETLCKAIGERSEMFYDLLIKLNGLFSDCTNMLALMIREKIKLFGDKEISVEDLSLDELNLIAITRALAGAVKAIIDTPVLSEDGKVSKESLNVYETTRRTIPDFTERTRKIKSEQGYENTTKSIPNVLETVDKIKSEQRIDFDIENKNSAMHEIKGKRNKAPRLCKAGYVCYNCISNDILPLYRQRIPHPVKSVFCMYRKQNGTCWTTYGRRRHSYQCGSGFESAAQAIAYRKKLFNSAAERYKGAYCR